MVRSVIVIGIFLICCQAFLLPKSPKMPTAIPQNNYPIRAAYIDRMISWYGMSVAAGLGVPGYATPHEYNYIIFAFWGCKAGPMDVGLAWQNISMYLGEKNPWGTENKEVQRGVRKAYNDAGVKILISAFGATEFPTTYYQDPVACGTALGRFVLENNLDGADIDWEDNTAMEAGKGEQWLIDFTIALRKTIPDHIITHCPQAPYFKSEYYPNGGYVTVHKAVGDLINFYMVQFYNQGDTKYNTYTELIEHATGTFSGTSLMEIAKRGIPLKKLVITKPILPNDATNTGYMPAAELREAVDKCYTDHKWYGGISHWQYPSDTTGATLAKIIDGLIAVCKETKKWAFRGTSVKEIADRGIPLQKLVIGKPLIPTDATNTGFVAQTDLGAWTAQAYDAFGWYAGVGHWQYSSGVDGQAIRQASGPLLSKCAGGTCV